MKLAMNAKDDTRGEDACDRCASCKACEGESMGEDVLVRFGFHITSLSIKSTYFFLNFVI